MAFTRFLFRKICGKKTIPGALSGLIGPVIAGFWKGIPYLRSRPKKSDKPPTARQLALLARFRLAVRFLKPLNELLRFSFPDLAVRMSGFNYAIRHNMNNAITGLYPDYRIDPALVLLSRGELPKQRNR